MKKHKGMTEKHSGRSSIEAKAKQFISTQNKIKEKLCKKPKALSNANLVLRKVIKTR